MRIEKLNNNFKKKLTLGIIGGVGIGLILGFSTSQSKYQLVDNIDFVEGVIHINKSKGDLNVLAININDGSGNYTEVDEIPTDKMYELNNEESYCEIKQSDGSYAQDRSKILFYEPNSQTFSVSPMNKKGTRCYLYLDEKTSYTSNEVLAKLGLTSIGELPTSTFANVEKGVGGIYEMYDDDGTSYYFRGAVTNNYVKFANKCWRIIRINGDGSIRLIYDGTTCKANGNGEVAISNTSFNSNYNAAYYVGFTYGSSTSMYGKNSSTIKTALDTWYITNITTNYAKSLDLNAGFCGDRTSTTADNAINYGARTRLVGAKMPSLKCEDSANDLYTINGAKKDGKNRGNQKLRNPIGLITADEVALAGGVWNTNNQAYYLYNGKSYRTLSPCDWNGAGAGVFSVYSAGGLGRDDVSLTPGVRPVINISSAATISSATGTQTDPYIVS